MQKQTQEFWPEEPDFQIAPLSGLSEFVAESLVGITVLLKKNANGNGYQAVLFHPRPGVVTILTQVGELTSFQCPRDAGADWVGYKICQPSVAESPAFYTEMCIEVAKLEAKHKPICGS